MGSILASLGAPFWLFFELWSENLEISKNLVFLNCFSMIFEGSGTSRGSFLEPKALPKTAQTPRHIFRDQKWLPNRFPSALGEPPGPKKKSWNFQERPGRNFRRDFIRKKPGYHGTGSAFGARAASKTSEARARRSQQTLQTETEKKHQEEQEPPRAGQQEYRDSEPGHWEGARQSSK